MPELSLNELDGDSLPHSGDRLQILSHEEYELLWGFPRFTQSDRDLFFTLTAPEREALEARARQAARISSRPIYVLRKLVDLLRRERVVATV